MFRFLQELVWTQYHKLLHPQAKQSYPSDIFDTKTKTRKVMRRRTSNRLFVFDLIWQACTCLVAMADAIERRNEPANVRDSKMPTKRGRWNSHATVASCREVMGCEIR